MFAHPSQEQKGHTMKVGFKKRRNKKDQRLFASVEGGKGGGGGQV